MLEVTLAKAHLGPLCMVVRNGLGRVESPPILLLVDEKLEADHPRGGCQHAVNESRVREPRVGRWELHGGEELALIDHA